MPTPKSRTPSGKPSQLSNKSLSFDINRTKRELTGRMSEPRKSARLSQISGESHSDSGHGSPTPLQKTPKRTPTKTPIKTIKKSPARYLYGSPDKSKEKESDSDFSENADDIEAENILSQNNVFERDFIDLGNDEVEEEQMNQIMSIGNSIRRDGLLGKALNTQFKEFMKNLTYLKEEFDIPLNELFGKLNKNSYDWNNTRKTLDWTVEEDKAVMSSTDVKILNAICDKKGKENTVKRMEYLNSLF